MAYIIRDMINDWRSQVRFIGREDGKAFKNKRTANWVIGKLQCENPSHYYSLIKLEPYNEK